MGYLIDILIGAVSRIVTGELGAHVEPIARWIIGKAVERLPADSRARYREEWLAHMAETPGLLRKLWHAFGCHIGASKVASVLAQRADRASKLVVDTEGETEVEILLATRRASAEISERFLRRVGAELHDGPAQLITLALLRLNSLRPLMAPEHVNSEEFEKIHGVLHDCLREIRHLSAGLAPPHVDSVRLHKVLELAVRQHEQRTGSTVDAIIDPLPDISPFHKVCIYRFVQQGLQNSYRHAAGVGQRVCAVSDGTLLAVEVADDGPGFCPSKSHGGDRLGLASMRDRIESLGGTFTLETQVGFGTRVRASFPLPEL